MANNSKKYTVLLLSAPIGSGHRLCYLWILGCCPWLYELAYKWGDNQKGSLWLRGLINRTLACLGGSFLRGVHPDAVIATHATPAGIMSYYKRKHPEIFLGAVITDFTVHKWWLVEGVDAYFVADALLKEKITVPSQVYAFGIPVRQALQNNDYTACREKYGWSDKEKVCLIMGGGEGLLPMEEMLKALRSAKLQNLRLIAITGHNEGLAQKLRQHFVAKNQASNSIFNTANPENFGHYQQDTAIEIYGFRDDVPQMLAAADMIITKAGGLTCAEVLASGLKLLIYKPLPGQEQGNASFLQNHYGAQVCQNTAELVESVKELLAKDEHLFMKKPLGNPFAAEQICALVLEKLAKKNIV